MHPGFTHQTCCQSECCCQENEDFNALPCVRLCFLVQCTFKYYQQVPWPHQWAAEIQLLAKTVTSKVHSKEELLSEKSIQKAR